jgi:DNA-binding MarR family transcriptional regulator
MQKISGLYEVKDDANFALMIRRVREGLMGQLEKELASIGVELNYSQYLVLKLIANYGPQMPGELAKWLDHNAGAMTRLLDRLEDKGYVRRQPHAEDRRALTIELTQAGQALWQTINKCSERAQETSMKNLNAAERSKLFALLKRVRDTLEKSS